MRVQIATHIASAPGGESYSAGDIVDLEPRIATAWLREGYAIPVREEPVEQAVAVGGAESGLAARAGGRKDRKR